VAASTRDRAGGVIAVLPFLLDFVVPLAAYYALTAAGVSSFWSLTIGGALTGIVSVVNTIRRGKIDALGLLVIAEIALGLVLVATTRDPRLVLARSSLYLALAGIWVLASAIIRRPVTVATSKAFAARSDGARGIAAVEWLTANSEPFLRIHRRLSALWGVMFLVYAVVRVTVIYSTSVSRAVAISEIPGIIAIGICLIASRRAGKRLEALANDRLRQADEIAAGLAAAFAAAHQQHDPAFLELLRMPAQPDADRGQRELHQRGEEDGLDPLDARRGQDVEPGVDQQQRRRRGGSQREVARPPEREVGGGRQRQRQQHVEAGPGGVVVGGDLPRRQRARQVDRPRHQEDGEQGEQAPDPAHHADVVGDHDDGSWCGQSARVLV
jgi:hypothetical protein